jgi:hypothetical protein
MIQLDGEDDAAHLCGRCNPYAISRHTMKREITGLYRLMIGTWYLFCNPDYASVRRIVGRLATIGRAESSPFPLPLKAQWRV